MSNITTLEELHEAAEEAVTDAVHEYLVGRGIMSAERFRIVHEEVCGEKAGRRWVNENRDDPRFGVVKQAAGRGRRFEECTPALLHELLAVDDSGFDAWWAIWGSDQQPSNSWTRSFLDAVCLAVNQAMPEPVPGWNGTLARVHIAAAEGSKHG